MERIGTVERKTRTRVFDEGHFRGHTEYLIESEAGPRPAPQAFLVHQRPGWVLPVHYHLEEQFQVVTRGSGRLGRHSVGLVHPAGRPQNGVQFHRSFACAAELQGQLVGFGRLRPLLLLHLDVAFHRKP